jgi:hypothetical protein
MNIIRAYKSWILTNFTAFGIKVKGLYFPRCRINVVHFFFTPSQAIGNCYVCYMFCWCPVLREAEK